MFPCMCVCVCTHAKVQARGQTCVYTYSWLCCSLLVALLFYTHASVYHTTGASFVGVSFLIVLIGLDQIVVAPVSELRVI